MNNISNYTLIPWSTVAYWLCSFFVLSVAFITEVEVEVTSSFINEVEVEVTSLSINEDEVEVTCKI